MYAVGNPAYRARIRRESKCAISDCDPVTVDLTENKFVPSSYDNTVLYISDVKLIQNDMERLKPGRWLNNSLMNAGQALLKAKFPRVHGLQDVLLLRTLTFQPQIDHEFVQILNCADQHWVCISTIACKHQMVKVYKSMRTGDVPSNTKESVATLLKCSARTVYLVYPDVQQHAD